jgi:hypothetical protein
MQSISLYNLANVSGCSPFPRTGSYSYPESYILSYFGKLPVVRESTHILLLPQDRQVQETFGIDPSGLRP